VEVIEMKIGKQGIAGAALGAAATAVIMVTVYEGRVLLAGEMGKTELRAGQRASAATGGAPGPAVDARAGGPPRAAAPVAPPPAGGASRDELLARDAAQRKEIARLQARVGELEATTATAAKPGPDDAPPWKLDPTPDDLVKWARQCSVHFDTPQLSSEAYRLSRTYADQVGLSPDEIALVERGVEQVKARTLAQLRAIYVETTGNAQAAEDLSAEGMIREIQEKSGRPEASAAQRQLAVERAGLAPPPANPAARPPAERLLRVLTAVGDETEREIGKSIGPDRARALRAANQGWDSKYGMSGCPSDGDGK
jgi:hypothetical protein